MNKKRFYSIFSTLLLMAAILFTACADELTATNENKNAEKNLEGLTCFTTELPEGTRTSIDKDGVFRWTEGDIIHVQDDSGDWQESEAAIISSDGRSAQFFVPGVYEDAESYHVIYTKSGFDEETHWAHISIIPREVVQKSPNNADHLGAAGDCGVAVAKRRASGKFGFELVHQLAYIMFEPRVENTDQKVTLRSIRLIEISYDHTLLEGKDIRDTIPIWETDDPEDLTTGVWVDENSSGYAKNMITVFCGEDVKPVDYGFMKMADAQNYGFEIKNDTYAPYSGDTYEDGKPLGRVFLVVKPNDMGNESDTYDFKIEYEVSYEATREQRVTHVDLKLADDDPLFERFPWMSQNGEKTTIFQDVEKGFTEIQTKFSSGVRLEKNKYYRYRHLLKVPSPKITEGYDYKFGEYYMWGAREWFWNGVENYPVTWDGYQAENAPQPDENPRRAAQGDSGRWYGSAAEWKYFPGGFVNENYTQHGQPTLAPWKKATSSATNNSPTLNASQMSYYVIYGDAHFDNTTPWTLQYYRGFNKWKDVETPIVCYGGVWLKKKEAIEHDWGVTWPIDNDGSGACKSAPFYSFVNGTSTLHDKQYHLRTTAPWANFRKRYTNWEKYKETGGDDGGIWLKPWELDSGKDSTDYFFVPCLGLIEYQHPDHPGVPTLTNVGSQGYYWTNTPLNGNDGQTNWYAGGTDGYDNAYYLNIHHDYIALSWMQPCIGVQNGMRIATKGYDGFEGMFK